MLRIVFDMADLARVQLSPAGVTLAIEAFYSSLALRQRTVAPLFGDWRRQLRPLVPARAKPLFEVFDPYGPVPMFMVKRTDSAEVFTDHLLSVPRERWRADLAEAGYAARTAFAHRVASGEFAARRELADAIAAYRTGFDAFVQPMRALAEADLAHRGAVLGRDGLAGLFGSLHPAVRWRAPVLEIGHRDKREIVLGGRTLCLVPAVFLWRGPQVLAESSIVFLTYPVQGALGFGGAADGDPLEELLGRTRAAVLRAVRRGRSTGELAELLGISPASVSYQTAVLRRAGLIGTRRVGRAVCHQLTALGRQTVYAGQVPVR